MSEIDMDRHEKLIFYSTIRCISLHLIEDTRILSILKLAFA